MGRNYSPQASAHWFIARPWEWLDPGKEKFLPVASHQKLRSLSALPVSLPAGLLSAESLIQSALRRVKGKVRGSGSGIQSDRQSSQPIERQGFCSEVD